MEEAAAVDLMEYQAKELFARHGVPVTLGRVIENRPMPLRPPRNWAAGWW